MYTENVIRIMAGSMVLLSLGLAHFLAQPWWLLLAAFVALNLIQSGFTGFCPPEMLMRKLGMKSACRIAKGATDGTTKCCSRP